MRKHKEEFSSNKQELVDKVKKINWWEYIPIIGTYIYFVRFNYTKINYIYEIRKKSTSKLKIVQIIFFIFGLPFFIWIIILWWRDGWGFKYPMIFLLTSFTIQFFSPFPIQKLILKGLK